MSVQVQLMRLNEKLILANRSDLSQVTPSEESWVARGLGTLHLSPLRVWFASPHLISLAGQWPGGEERVIPVR